MLKREQRGESWGAEIERVRSEKRMEYFSYFEHRSDEPVRDRPPWLVAADRFNMEAV